MQQRSCGHIRVSFKVLAKKISVFFIILQPAPWPSGAVRVPNVTGTTTHADCCHGTKADWCQGSKCAWCWMTHGQQGVMGLLVFISVVFQGPSTYSFAWQNRKSGCHALMFIALRLRCGRALQFPQQLLTQAAWGQVQLCPLESVVAHCEHSAQ